MQRGQPTNISNYSTAKYVYDMINREITRNRAVHDTSISKDRVLESDIEYKVLCRIKKMFEQPEYVDEVLDGAS